MIAIFVLRIIRSLRLSLGIITCDGAIGKMTFYVILGHPAFQY